MTHLVLLLALSSPASGVELTTLRRGEVTARAEVRVADKGVGPGRGVVFFKVSLEGPGTLQVEGPRLEDALAAWRIGWQTSSWSGDQPGSLEINLGLVQLKPGAAPLPGVRLRVRGQPSETWQDVAWLDPLHEPRDVAPIVDLPPLPAPAWRTYLLPAASGAIVLLLVGLLLNWARRRQVYSPPIPAWRRALLLLDKEDGVEQVTGILRGFLHEQGALPTARLTTAELLSLLASQRNFPDDALAKLRQVLELADLVKFAGHAPSAEEAKAARLSVRELVEALATWPPGENDPVGEPR